MTRTSARPCCGWGRSRRVARLKRPATESAERLRNIAVWGNVGAMPADPRSELRALALWHTRRRAVDELLAPLLEYGPVAVDRVADRLGDIRMIVDDERRAFDAFVEILCDRDQSTAKVLDLFGRRAETTEVRDK